MEGQVANIIPAGFSGTGKSLVAEEVAQRLNWDFIDTDEEIVKKAAKPIAILANLLSSIALRSGKPAGAHYERSDICVVPAAGVKGCLPG